MEIVDCKIPDVKILSLISYEDNRGNFIEFYNVQRYIELNFPFTIKQVNYAFNFKKGTLRGLHFQLPPKAQSKIVACPNGALFDVVVDLRTSSPTFGKYITFIIFGNGLESREIEVLQQFSADYILQYNQLICIPKGFAHGVLSLSDSTSVMYFVDEFYSKELDRSIRWNDPTIGIQWLKITDDYIISEKDLNAPFLKDFDNDLF